MAKKTKEQKTITSDALEDELSAFLLKTTGIEVQSVQDVDVVTKYIDTGNYSLNYALTGDMLKGLPAGRIYTLEGESGRGKSLQSCRLAVENVRDGGTSIIIDVENAINGDFLTKIAGGNKELVDKVKVVNTISTIEDLQNFLNQLITFRTQKGAEKEMLLVVDSWSILSSKHEQQVVDDNDGKKDMSKAVAARQLLRALGGKLKSNKITLILVMHLTTNIGVMFGEKTTPASHGNAAIFMASTRAQLYATEEIKDKNENPIGTILNFKTKKNRFTYKHKEAKVAFYFSGPKLGIDRWSGVVETGVAWGIFESSAKKITPSTKITYGDYEFKAGEIETFAKDWDGNEQKTFIETLNEQLKSAIEGVEKDGDLSNYQDDDEPLEEAI
jgi:RecA/RadA recombinase